MQEAQSSNAAGQDLINSILLQIHSETNHRLPDFLDKIEQKDNAVIKVPSLSPKQTEPICLECFEPMNIPFVTPKTNKVKDELTLQANQSYEKAATSGKLRKLSASSAFVQVGSSPLLAPLSPQYTKSFIFTD